MRADQPTNSIAAFLLARLRGFGAHPILAGNSSCARPSWTAEELATAVEELAAGLLEIGVEPGDRVLVVADNCDLWLVCDLALLLIGAVDVPRAGDAALEDVLFVAEHSGSVRAILEDGKQLERAAEGLARLGLRDGAVLMKAGPALPEGVTSLEQVRELGRKADPARLEAARRAVSHEDLATIVYTSGTTGNPKGVMLEHRNILHNIRTLPDLVHFNVNDRYLSFLPSWHTFERTVEYCGLANGMAIHYSSKAALKKDLVRVRPTVVAGVPRLWESIAGAIAKGLAGRPPALRAILEGVLALSRRHLESRRRRGGEGLDAQRRRHAPSALGRMWEALVGALSLPFHALASKLIYSKLRAATGGEIRFLISGGGALPEHVDELLNRAGILLLVGYGLTETAPVVSLRLPEANVVGTSGTLLPETAWRVMDEDGTHERPAGEKGVLWIRGPQVMRGYYANETATKAVLREDGWFCSGDLAFLSDHGDVVICGRSKDTIVLRGGENVEPEYVEARILESPLVRDVLLVGHTQKHLAALVLPEPETLAELIPGLDREDLVAAAAHPETGPILKREIDRLVSPAAGFRIFERVPRLGLLDRAFSIEDGTLTATMKKRRMRIEEHYRADIGRLFEEGTAEITLAAGDFGATRENPRPGA